jgi:hypothetical protein
VFAALDLTLLAIVVVLSSDALHASASLPDWVRARSRGLSRATRGKRRRPTPTSQADQNPGV